MSKSEFQLNLRHRPRRNRKSAAIRSMLAETRLHPSQFVLPIFVREGENIREPIGSMPGVYRLSIDQVLRVAKEAVDVGICAVILFPVIRVDLKDNQATEAINKNGLLPRAIAALKHALPELVVMADVALDPYNSDGHDGLVQGEAVDNDSTVHLLCQQALMQAASGVDIVAPSDMMDGRIGAIRTALDAHGFTQVSILSYCAKYASGYYGPFREALASAPRFGDKKSYQMDPANRREAVRELLLDEAEGADILMVKPALAYLDVIHQLKRQAKVPIAAYQVSGEYSMVMAAGEKGWLDADRVMFENLLAIRRAGADLIFTYWALTAAQKL